MSDNHYFDLLNKTLERIEDKVDKNTILTQKVHSQAQQTNGKVIRLREDVDGLLVSTTNKKIEPSKLPDFWSDPMIRRTVFIVSVAFLTLIIAVTGVNIVGSFK